MAELKHCTTPASFQIEMERLLAERRATKGKKARKYALSSATRKLIHEKTAGRCHICGCDVPLNKFEADHVKSHSSGGEDIANNFLPSCKTCNNYRWHYSAEEIKWILKLGVWARWHVLHETSLGKLISTAFIAKENVREKRRRNPRLKTEA